MNSSPSAAIDTVAVAVLGRGAPSAARLREALVSSGVTAGARPGAYAVVDGDSATGPFAVDIVVCADTRVATIAATRWPDADVIVVLSAREDDGAVLDALGAGATLCLRGTEIGLVAAYVHAVLRRRAHTRRSLS